MSDQYNISFSTTTAVSSLDKLLERLNKIGTASDKLDGKKINPVTSTAKKGVDDLGNSLDKVFSRQMQQASQLFAGHLSQVETNSEKTKQSIESLTASLKKNRAQFTRNSKTNASATSSIHSGAQATAAWRAALGAAGASMGIFTSKTILVASAVYATVSAFKASVSAGVEFTDMMARVQAVTGASAETLEWMKEEVRSFAGETIFTAKEGADALLQLGMAGLTATQSIEAMPATLRLATIGVLSTSEAADLATNVMTQFRMEAVHLTAIVDDLATVATNSNTSVKQLGLALTYTGPAAYNAGVSIQETTAAIGALASAGIKGSRAGTAMRRVIQMIVAPSAKAKKVLNEMGVATQDAYGNALPLMSIIDKLAKGNLSYAQAIELVTLKQASGLQSLVANREELGKHIEAQKDNANAAKDFQKTLEDTLGADYRLLVSAAYEKMLQFFDANEEGFRSLVQGATEFVKAIDVDKLMQTLSSLKDIAGNLALALAGVWGVSTLSKLSKFTSSLSVAGEVMDNGTKKANLLGVALSTVGRSIPGMVILAGVAGAMAVSFAMAEAKAAATAEELARVRKLAGRDDEKKAKLDDQIAEYEKQLKELKDTRKDLSILENDDKAAEFLRKNAEATKLYEGMLEKAREEREALTKAEKEARLLQLRNKLGESPTSMLMDERASIFSVISKLEGIRDSASAEGKDVSSFQKTIDAYYEKLEILNKKIKETGELTEEQATERAKLLTEISNLEADLYTDTKDVVVRKDEDLNKTFLKRAEAAVAAVKKKNAAEKASEYKRILTEQNKTLEHQELYVRKNIKSELDLHNARVSNFEEYKTNVIGAYDAEIAAETAAMDKLKAKRQEAINKGELYNDPAYIETAEKIAELEQERAKAVTSLNSQEVELGRTRETTLANYTQGLISTRVLIERVTAAQEKYNKAVEAANDTYKPGSTAHSDALVKAKKELQGDLRDAAGTTGERFAATLLDSLSGIGQEVADAVASGDYSGLKGALSGAIGSTIGDSITSALGNNLGGLMGDVAADSFSGMAGGAMGGVLGAVGGGLAGGLVSGLLAGSKTEITGEGYRLGLESGELFSAEFSKSFKKSSMFSSKRWTSYSDMLLSEFDVVSNSLDRSASSVGNDASKLGIAIDEYTGVIEDKNGDLAGAGEKLADEMARSGLAAIEKYQLLGESAADTFGRLADTADNLTESFKTTGVSLSNKSSGWIDEESSRLADAYSSDLEASQEKLKQVQINIIGQALTGYKGGGWKDEELRASIAEQMTGLGGFSDAYQQIITEAFEAGSLDQIATIKRTEGRIETYIDPILSNISELNSRIDDVYNDAVVAFNQGIVSSIADIKNIDTGEAEEAFGALASSYAENYLTEAEQLANTAKFAKQEFLSLGFSEQDLDASTEAVRAFYDAASSPEEIANALVAADALARYNTAIEESAEVLKEALDTTPWDNLTNIINIEIDALNSLKDAADTSLSALQASIDAENELNEARQQAVGDQIEASESLVDKLQALYDKLDDAIYSASGATEAQRYAQAQSEISVSLQEARATGTLPLDGELDRALSAIQDIDSSAFSSAAEMAFEQAKTANQLLSLQDITGEQLTAEQQALAMYEAQLAALEAQEERLNDIYENAEAQLDALLDADHQAMSIEEALDRLNKDLANLDEADYSAKMSYYQDSLDYYQQILDTLQNGYYSGTVEDAIGATEAATQAAVTDGDIAWGVNEIIGKHGGVTDEAAIEMYNTAKAYGVSLDRLKPFLPQENQNNMESWLGERDMPMFAAGGLHQGGYRLVGEKGPEIEAVGPARYYSASKTQQMLSGGGGVTKDGIDAMTRLLQSVDSNTGQIQRDIRNWNYAGLPPTRDIV